MYNETLKWHIQRGTQVECQNKCLRFINLFIHSFYLFIYSSIHLFQYSG